MTRTPSTRPALIPVVLIELALLLACGGSGGSSYTPPPQPVPQARMVIGDTTATHECAGFFSSCSRATCIVINAGDGTGSVNVEMTVTSGSGQEQTHGESLVLDPGDRKTVSYDFNGFDATHVECKTR